MSIDADGTDYDADVEQIHDPELDNIINLMRRSKQRLAKKSKSKKKKDMADMTITKSIQVPMAVVLKLIKKYVASLEGVDLSKSVKADLIINRTAEEIEGFTDTDFYIEVVLPIDYTPKQRKAAEKEVVERKIEVGQL